MTKINAYPTNNDELVAALLEYREQRGEGMSTEEGYGVLREFLNNHSHYVYERAFAAGEDYAIDSQLATLDGRTIPARPKSPYWRSEQVAA